MAEMDNAGSDMMGAVAVPVQSADLPQFTGDKWSAQSKVFMDIVHRQAGIRQYGTAAREGQAAGTGLIGSGLLREGA